MSATVSELLTLELTPPELKLNARLLSDLHSEFMSWRRTLHHDARARLRSVPRHARNKDQENATEDYVPNRRDRRNADTRQVLDFLLASIPAKIERLTQLKVDHRDFRQTMSLAVSDEERRSLVMQYAAQLGASHRQLQGDRRSLDRWFGEEAATARFRRRVGETEQQVEFYLRRLGVVAAHTVRSLARVDDVPAFWQRIGIDSVFQQVLEYGGDIRLQRAVLAALRLPMAAVPDDQRGRIFSPNLRERTRNLAADRSADVWSQCAAMELLQTVDSEACDHLLAERLTNPGEEDDMFVRRHAIRLLSRGDQPTGEQVDLLRHLSGDPSPFVRQQVPMMAWQASAFVASYWLHYLMREDEVPQVRAAAIAYLLDAPSRTELNLPLANILLEVLREESDVFVLRTALHVTTQFLLNRHRSAVAAKGQDSPQTAEDGDELARFYQQHLVPQIRQIQARGEPVTLRRYASLAAERIWVELDRSARRVLVELQPTLAGVGPGKSKWISRRILGKHEPTTIGRVLSVLAQEDYGFDVQRNWRGCRITRTPAFGFRWWRLLHELRNPSTDKRQAYSHTIGRVSTATLRCPSAVLAELSQTEVPGEPLYLPDEGGWRPYLPLVDDFVSVLDVSFLRRRTVRFFSSQGQTAVSSPQGMWRWLRAKWRLTWSFAEYAEKRNWRSDAEGAPTAYLEAMKELGFAVSFREHADTAEHGTSKPPVDDSVRRFFPCCLLALSVPQLVDGAQTLTVRFAEYFNSVFENSLSELLVFTGALSLLFFGSHFVANWQLRRARGSIGLSVGGWGTRGKSGTERLKAALLNGLGYSLISKTTGCEAMFLQGDSYGPLREVPLFRPYDKASIWEHSNVVRMAARLRSSVFLWECMGLTPSYIDVLQRQWTCDDLATITNAYPDHEDLQGPAGWNVATTIAGFSPRNARVITTEQQMRPLLHTACHQVRTSLSGLGWLESGLLTDDVMNRFPYTEHPDNVALVAAMAEDLGIERDVALKEMADQLIADLGVLRTYPVAELGTRRLEFTNGMSANERFGCMGNWQRAGFADHDPQSEPGTSITTVVNNRADRVARSRVFASILARDLSADRHVLIGGNLGGLLGFIWEEWEDAMHDFSLSAEKQGSPAEHFENTARRMRQATSPAHVERGVTAMLQGIAQMTSVPWDAAQLAKHWEDPQALSCALAPHELPADVVGGVLEHQGWLLRSWREYCQMVDRIESAGSRPQAAVDDSCRALLRVWFERKLVVVEDYDATGEQIVERIRRVTPPGFLNRLMGLQNIKGTGLDFVYRWQAWQVCHEACQAVLSGDVRRVSVGLDSLLAFQEYGALCEAKVRNVLDTLRTNPELRRLEDPHYIEVISTRLETAMQQIREGHNADTGDATEGLLDRTLALLEGFLDLAQSVRRRKRADTIYRDLQNERISVDEAIVELRELNQQQKGGWLAKAVKKHMEEAQKTVSNGTSRRPTETTMPSFQGADEEVVVGR